jgi:predicted ATPase
MQFLGLAKSPKTSLLNEHVTYFMTFLAAKDGWVSREELAQLLWEELSTSQQLTRLRQLLYRVKLLGLGEHLEIKRTLLRWKSDCDLRIFKKAILNRQWELAIKTYQGSLLEGVEVFEPPEFGAWLQFEREHLSSDFSRATLELSELQPNNALDILERAYDVEPLNQALLGALLNHADLNSIRLQRIWKKHLQHLTELELQPEVSLTALVNRLESGFGSSVAPIRHLPQAQAELQPTTTFVGRLAELETLQTWFQTTPTQNKLGHSRLMTITGLGGTGKTQLAQAFCAQLSTASNSVFVSLASTDKLEYVPQAILGKLQLQSKTDAKTTLLEHLKTYRGLLVLDNTEQIAGIEDLVAQLLGSCPELYILCTSRAMLGLQSEMVLQLQGFPAPVIDSAFELQDSMLCFVSAARRRKPEFSLNREDYPVFLRLHQAVAGLPLGFELAAGWLHGLSLESIVQMIETDLMQLESSAADVPPRQRSFKAVFDSSWRLLNSQQQSGLAALSVLRGLIDLEMARAIGVQLPTLMALIQKSLLKREGNLFYLHEMIRQYAEQTLSQTQRRETFERLLEYSVQYSQFYKANSTRSDYLHLRSLTIDLYDNLRLALEFAVNTNRSKAILIMTELNGYWTIQGKLKEAQFWFEQIVADDLSQVDLDCRLRFLIQKTTLMVSLVGFEESLDYLAQLKAAIDQSPAKIYKAEYYLCSGVNFYSRAKFQEAFMDFKQAEELFRNIDQKRHAYALHLLGTACFALEQTERGKECVHLAIKEFRICDNNSGLTAAMSILASTYLKENQDEAALLTYQQSLVIAKKLKDGNRIAYILSGIGQIFKKQQLYVEARTYFQEALKYSYRARHSAYFYRIFLFMAEIEIHSNPTTALQYMGFFHFNYGRLVTTMADFMLTSIENLRANSGFSASHCEYLEQQGAKLGADEVFEMVMQNRTSDASMPSQQVSSHGTLSAA